MSADCPGIVPPAALVPPPRTNRDDMDHMEKIRLASLRAADAYFAFKAIRTQREHLKRELDRVTRADREADAALEAARNELNMLLML